MTAPPNVLTAHQAYPLLRRRPAPYMQAAEAAMAIDASCTVQRLTTLLDSSGRTSVQHEADVRSVIGDLVADGLLVATAEGQLRAARGLAELVDVPLGLGPPLRRLLQDQTAESVKSVLRQLGVKAPARKAEIVEVALQRLGDPDFVRTVLATAPPPIRDELLAEAQGMAVDDDLRPFNSTRYRFQQEVRTWASRRGLVFGGSHGYALQMPSEVRLALLGPDARAPFSPVEPAAIVRPVDATRLAGYSAAAATDFADHAVAILDRISRAPLTRLKSGGVGVRELTRLSKVTQSEPSTTRLVVELSAAAGLLGYIAGKVGVTAEFGHWRDRDPADRLVVLLRAWWSYGEWASATTDGQGASRPALEEPSDCSLCIAAKVAVVTVLAEVDGGMDAAQVAARARWRDPFAHIGPGPDVAVPSGNQADSSAGTAVNDSFTVLWRELHTLGLVADGALTPLGRAVLASQWSTATTLLSTALPPVADKALFGADLTAYVAGAPTSAVSALLDSAADREGRGGAVAWRFSADSVRRAMDAGATAPSLLAALAAIAEGNLPQPLTYLIEEVGQRHGSLLVSAAVSLIRSDDAALLAQVVADRTLKAMELRQVGPTVVASQSDPDSLLTALRTAGYLPMPEGVQRTPMSGRGSGRGSTARPPARRTRRRG